MSGGDNTSIEVKAAAGGLPESLASTLCALANMPGGGTIILGLDERTGFHPVPLADPQKLKQGLAGKARGFIPPVRLDVGDAQVDGSPVVVARVHECDQSFKPCKVASTGKAYLRGYDGDYLLSALEEQAFLAARSAPMADRLPVDDATPDDLDPELAEAFTASTRRLDPQGRGRFSDDGELLRRSGVLHSDGRPTVAGVLALGLYPQQWFPRFVIQAAAEPAPGEPATARARNQVTIDGPVPRMLDQAMAWARRTFDTYIVNEPDGTVRDRYVYPLAAFRELIANAIIHRDLNPWSAGLAIEVRLRRDRLVIGNPGGLYGITVDRLGQDAVTSARNARLVAICQHVYSAETGARAIEALASGIPIVTEAIAEAGLPPARYTDSGIRFTVVLHRQAPQPAVMSPSTGSCSPPLNLGRAPSPSLRRKPGSPPTPSGARSAPYGNRASPNSAAAGDVPPLTGNHKGRRGDGSALGRCRDDVPVVGVGQPDSRLELFPAGDHGVVEDSAHLRGALAGVDARVNLLSGRLRLGEDPAGLQRTVQALLGHAQEGCSSPRAPC